MRLITSMLCIICALNVTADNATLAIGVGEHNPPYIMYEDGSAILTGFEVSLLKKVCQQIQKKCIFKSFPRIVLRNKINAGEVDLAVGSIPITKDMMHRYIMSIPYLLSKYAVIVRKSDDYQNLNQLKNKKFASNFVSSWPRILQKRFKSKPKVVLFANPLHELQALKLGVVDAIIIDSRSANFWVSNFSNSIKTLGAPTQYALGYGIVVSPKKRSLVNAVNKALSQLEDNGEYQKLYDFYF